MGLFYKLFLTETLKLDIQIGCVVIFLYFFIVKFCFFSPYFENDCQSMNLTHISSEFITQFKKLQCFFIAQINFSYSFSLSAEDICQDNPENFISAFSNYFIPRSKPDVKLAVQTTSSWNAKLLTFRKASLFNLLLFLRKSVEDSIQNANPNMLAYVF